MVRSWLLIIQLSSRDRTHCTEFERTPMQGCRQTSVCRATGQCRPKWPATLVIFVRKSLSHSANVRQRLIRGLPHMLVGYMRVSSADERQSVDLQRDALLTAGVAPGAAEPAFRATAWARCCATIPSCVAPTA